MGGYSFMCEREKYLPSPITENSSGNLSNWILYKKYNQVNHELKSGKFSIGLVILI